MAIALDTLRSVPLLNGIKDRELKKLAASLRERRYGDGEVVVKEGAGGIGFFLLLEGTAEVSIRGEVRGALKAGDFFGELGLLDDEAGRSATVTASGDLTCAALTSWQFKPFLADHPDAAWELMRTMARRLNETERHHAAAGAA